MSIKIIQPDESLVTYFEFVGTSTKNIRKLVQITAILDTSFFRGEGMATASQSPYNNNNSTGFILRGLAR